MEVDNNRRPARPTGLPRLGYFEDSGFAEEASDVTWRLRRQHRQEPPAAPAARHLLLVLVVIRASG